VPPDDDIALDHAVPVDWIADGQDSEVGPTSTGSGSAVPAGLTMEPADIELALRYLTGFDVLILADTVDADGTAVAVEAAAYAGARLVVVQQPGTAVGDVGPDATVVQAPEADPDGAFAELIGSFVAALDRGEETAAAFRASVGAAGWTAAVEP
jgi:hypothetical protein